jgi:lauroyl/myristoyl acyltransferase
MQLCPSNLRFVRDPPKAVRLRRVISGADVRTVFRLAFSLLVAWFVPQKFWPPVARGMSRLADQLAGKATPPVTSRITSALETDAATAGALAAQYRGAQYEVAFQCIRGYRYAGWHPKITVRGGEHIDAALRSGKGCILWVAHFMFAPNVVKVGLHAAGYTIRHLSRPEHGFSPTRFGITCLNPVRTHFEDRFLAERIRFERAHPARALMRTRKIVAQNGIVSFTAGAWEGRSTVEARFLGSRIVLALGPVWLARITTATLLPVFATRTHGANEFLVTIGAPIDVHAGATEEQSYIRATEQFLKAHEPHITEYPSQWEGWPALKDGERTSTRRHPQSLP